MVDSVKLPVEFIRADGSAITSEGYGFQGQFDELVISVSRHFYQQYAPDMVAEVISELSGFQLGDSAQLMIDGPLGIEYIDLGIVQRQDNIYAPWFNLCTFAAEKIAPNGSFGNHSEAQPYTIYIIRHLAKSL